MVDTSNKTIMRLSFTKDEDILRHVFFSLWEQIAQDGQHQEQINLSKILKDAVFVKVEKNGELAGIVAFEQRHSFWEVHMNMLPGFRGKFAERAFKEACAMLKEHKPGINRIVAVIPDMYPNISAMATRCGFTNITSGPDWRKHGKTYSSGVYECRL